MGSAPILKEMRGAYKFNKLLTKNVKDPMEFMKKIRDSREKYERQLKVLNETNTNAETNTEMNSSTRSNEVLNDVYSSVKFELYGEYINEVASNIASSIKRKSKPWIMSGIVASGCGLYAMCSYFIAPELFTLPIKLMIGAGTVASVFSFNLIYEGNKQSKILKALKKKGLILEEI